MKLGTFLFCVLSAVAVAATEDFDGTLTVEPLGGLPLNGAARVRLKYDGGFYFDNGRWIQLMGKQDQIDVSCPRNGDFPCNYVLTLYVKDGMLFGNPLLNEELLYRPRFEELGRINEAGEVSFSSFGVKMVIFPKNHYVYLRRE